MSLCCFPGLGYDPYNGSSLSYVKETAPERELGIIYPGQAKEPKAKGKFPGQLGIVQGIPLEPEPGQKLLENQRASVKVPPRSYVGDTIHVSIPDGRTISTTVPPMCTPGSSFILEIPSSPVDTLIKSDLSVAAPVHINGGDFQNTQTSVLDSSKQNSTSRTPSSGQNDYQVSVIPQNILLRVSVPVGTLPGTIIHVQVPGDNRGIPAIVPPGVCQFNVSVPPIQDITDHEQLSYEQMMGYPQMQESYKAKNNNHLKSNTENTYEKEHEYKKVQHFKYEQQHMYETAPGCDENLFGYKGRKNNYGNSNLKMRQEPQQKHSLGSLSPRMVGPALMGEMVFENVTGKDKTSRNDVRDDDGGGNDAFGTNLSEKE